MRMLHQLAAVSALATAVMLAGAGTALADPQDGSGNPVVPAVSDAVGVGSDTTEFPLDQLSIDYNATNPVGSKLYSWDATNPATGVHGDSIVTKSGAAAIPRPDGSSAGILALDNNVKSDGTHYDIDFARSSRGRQSSDPLKQAGGIVFVALARDAVSYATQATSNVPTNLSTAQLTSIYNCTQTTWPNIKPFLPQTGSGTRAFFLKAIGVTTPGACVNSTVQENDGTQALLNDAWAIVPYSVSKYIAQADHSAPLVGGTCTPTGTQNKFGCDKHGTMVLNSVNGIAPTSGVHPNRTINSSFVGTSYGRTVYDVVRYASTPDNIPAYLEPIFASKTATVPGWVCKAAPSTANTDLTNYGLLSSPLCGIGG